MSTVNPTSHHTAQPFGSYALVLKTLAKGKFPALQEPSINTIIKMERDLTTAGRLLTHAYKHATLAHNDVEKGLSQALTKANEAQDRDLMAQHSRISKEYSPFRDGMQTNGAAYQALKEKYHNVVSALEAARKSPAEAANLIKNNQPAIKEIISEALDYDKKSRLLEHDIVKFSGENLTRAFAQHGIRSDLKPRNDNTPQLS